MASDSEQQPRPPEADLIFSLRERAPRQSMKQAALKAGISDTRWRDIENGYKYVMGQRAPVKGPALAVAKMVRAVGGTPEQLRQAGREDAAGELEVLLLDVKVGPWSEAQRRWLREQIDRDSPSELTNV